MEVFIRLMAIAAFMEWQEDDPLGADVTNKLLRLRDLAVAGQERIRLSEVPLVQREDLPLGSLWELLNQISDLATEVGREAEGWQEEMADMIRVVQVGRKIMCG